MLGLNTWGYRLLIEPWKTRLAWSRRFAAVRDITVDVQVIPVNAHMLPVTVHEIPAYAHRIPVSAHQFPAELTISASSVDKIALFCA